MDPIKAELKELRKQLYTYRYKSLELERQLRTQCNAFHCCFDHKRGQASSSASSSTPTIDAFQDALPSFVKVFTNGLILEIIANHLPAQDLLSCRLVCKRWAHEMAKFITQRKALVVAYEDCSEARELLKKKRDGKFVNITTLCILEIPVKSQIITDLLNSFGETLSGLKLDDCSPEPEDLISLLRAIPNLEVLSFKQTGIRRRGRNQDSTEVILSRIDGMLMYSDRLRMPSLKKMIWEEINPVVNFEKIIQMFPNLEELELLCPVKPSVERLQGMKLDSLKHLVVTCDSNYTEKQFLALANLQLKLKKLTLHDIRPGGRKKMRGLRQFLESCRETLKELRLDGIGRTTTADEDPRRFIAMNTPFPVEFPELKILDIDCSLITDLKMLDYTPKLESFECKFHDWRGWWHLINRGGTPQPHGHIRDVSLGAIDSGCLMKISQCFKTVSKLEIAEDRIDDVAFRVLCSSMKQLSQIRITTSSNSRNRKLHLTDFGVTGIPEEECRKLREENEKGEGVKKTLEEIGALRKFPFIGDLKGLYSLELACSELLITDVSVLYGISQLQRVSTITLPKCNLTDKSLTSLGNLPNLLVLELHKSCGVTTAGVNALRQEKRDLVLNLYADLNSRLFS